MECGIYIIKNLINNKIYVGSSQNIKRRFYLHKHYLKKKEHTNIHLQTAWDLYGEENFSFSILETVESKEKLCVLEKYYIDFFKATDREKGYNICDDTMAPMRNRKHNEVSIKKMIDSKTGEKNSFFGKHHTEETKNKIKQSKLGKHLPEDCKEKVLATAYKKGQFNINAKLTDEIAEQIREDFNTYQTKYGTYKILSEKYNVHHSTIRRIIQNKTYK